MRFYLPPGIFYFKHLLSVLRARVMLKQGGQGGTTLLREEHIWCVPVSFAMLHDDTVSASLSLSQEGYQFSSNIV